MSFELYFFDYYVINPLYSRLFVEFVSTLQPVLHLQQINIVQFKNYEERLYDFSERITGICGKNGVGKTNLLDAIHYLCFTKSYFSRSDVPNIKYGNTGFRIEGRILVKEMEEKAVCILRETGKKEFAVNEENYSRFSHHIGRYPCVVIAPDDAALITGDSRKRRNFLDAIISQFDKNYLQQLIVYQKILQQRNACLKNIAETGQSNFALLDILDQQLATPGNLIFQTRNNFLIPFFQKAISLYHQISASGENISLLYETELQHNKMEALLKAHRSKDMLLQRTVSGIHRDELVILMDNQPFKQVASQGQRKSLLFALKLAELEVLKEEKGFAPILLLDDVFEKLDESRIQNLLERVCVINEGQVLITDTNEERLAAHLDQLKLKYQLIRL